MRSLALLPLFLLPTFARAQAPTHALPASYSGKEGGTHHWVPGHFAPSFAQTTYSSAEIDRPTGPIHALWLRPDSHSGQLDGGTFEVTVWMSSRGVPAPSHVLTDSYAQNRGTDYRMVADRVRVQFPAHTPSGSEPQPWRVRVPIQAFHYRSGDNLQIEWALTTPNKAPATVKWFTDAHDFTPQSSSGYFYRAGADRACPKHVTVYAGQVGGPGQLCSIWFYSMGGAGLPAATFFGTRTDQWNGVPLPIDLAPLGFRDCSIWTDLQVAISGVTDTPGSGRFRIDLPLPFDSSLAQRIFWTQTFVLDPSFGGGLRASDLGKVTIGRTVRTVLARHLYTYSTALTDHPEFASWEAPIVGIE